MTNPETPLEIAKEWEAELSVMASGLDETIMVKTSDIRALALAVIELEGFEAVAAVRRDERARVVAAIYKRHSHGMQAWLIELASWIEEGCPDDDQ